MTGEAAHKPTRIHRVMSLSVQHGSVSDWELPRKLLLDDDAGSG